MQLYILIVKLIPRVAEHPANHSPVYHIDIEISDLINPVAVFLLNFSALSRSTYFTYKQIQE